MSCQKIFSTTTNGDLQRELNVKYSALELDAYSEILAEVSSRMTRSQGLWRCTVCKFESRLKSDTFKHVEEPVFAICVIQTISLVFGISFFGAI